VAPAAAASRRYVVSTAPARPSSAAGCRSGRALRGFAATEVQINETETPLHRLETVYRRLVEHLGTADTASGAFRGVIDGWFYALEQDVLADASVDPAMRRGCCSARMR
jgi:hypothetical protein